jgi:hypothetical protein
MNDLPKSIYIYICQLIDTYHFVKKGKLQSGEEEYKLKFDKDDVDKYTIFLWVFHPQILFLLVYQQKERKFLC